MPLRSSLLVAASLVVAAPVIAKTKVVATNAALAALARDVGGPDVDVVALLEPHEDAHTATPRPAMAAALQQADLLIEVGLGLEAGWLPQVKAQAKNAKLAPGGRGVLDASTLVEPLEVPVPGGPAAGNHPAGNPHYLADPARAAKVAKGIAERLAALDAPAAQKARERAAFLAGKLEERARTARAELSRKVPAERRRVATYHASFAYLAAALGVEQVVTIEATPGAAVDAAVDLAQRAAQTAAQNAAAVERIKKSGATALVVDESMPRKQARALAKAAGVRLAVLPGGPRLGVGDTFLTYVDRTVSEVYAGVAQDP
ncbi:MAG: zinc ABC transporter substrate-binding protein [Deltaproteobacteria bacterium]|nr:zinc ABC transporter substrate-binding protein [Deltaproteobacteria bacterium]